MNRKFFIAQLIGITACSSGALAQDYGAMLNQQLQQSNALANQMQQMEQGIVQQNVQNPQVQASYQQYLAQGGNMSFDQYAYQYAATGGFTPEGKAFYNQNERQIQQREGQAIQDYRNYTNNLWDQTGQYRRESADRQAHQVGNLMAGTSDYIDPSTGQQWNLPNTQTGQFNYDNGSGNTFYNDSQGNYYRGDQNGYWYGMQEAE